MRSEFLRRESWQAFLANPITGVGAGQFKNYNPEGRQEAWRESHNAGLQVAAELGVAGLLIFGFLVVRAMATRRQVRTLLRRAAAADPPVITPSDEQVLGAHAAMVAAGIAGWFFCALFASVAYGWTFYYLLGLAVAPREILLDRLGSARAAGRTLVRRAGLAHAGAR